MTLRTANGITALYRFWSATDALLYIGITHDLGRRLGQHEADKPWWAGVSRITIETHEDRDQALAAERAAIKAESPLWNVVHNRPGSTSRRHGGLPKRKPGSATTRPAEPEPAPEIVRRRMFQKGDVVAIGLDNGECPVGMVGAVDDDGYLIWLFSFLTGCFDYGERWINDSQVRSFRLGRLLTDEAKREQGYRLDDGDVWDCEPLGNFQTAWKRRHADAAAPRLCARCGDLAP